MELEELKKLLIDIFRVDKTSEYDYIGNNAKSRRKQIGFVQDHFGRYPPSYARWQTPREIVLETWVHVLQLPEHDLWDKAKSELPRSF